jgi:hypothetical protein
MTRAIKILLLALVAVGSVGSLSGQGYRTFQDEYSDVSERNLFRFGPLRVLPTFRLSNVGYDSNVFYRDRGDEPVADYTATISPEIKGYWLFGHSVILSITDNPEYVFYLDQKSLRSFSNSYRPAARLLLLRRLALSGDYHFERHTRRASSEFETPVQDTRRGYAASAAVETPRGTVIGVSGVLDDYRFAELGAADVPSAYALNLDRRQRALDLEFYYRVFSRSWVFLRAGWSDYVFSHPEAEWRDAYSTQAYGGIRFPLAGRARGVVSLGYKKFVPRDPARKAFSGLVADTDVRFRVGRLGIQLGYLRNNYFSYYNTAYYFIEDKLRTGLSFYVFPFLRLDGDLQAGAWNYPEPHEVTYQGETYVVDNRKDVSRVVTLGLAVRIAGSSGLGLSFNIYRRRSNAPGFDIDRNFLGAYIVYDF